MVESASHWALKNLKFFSELCYNHDIVTFPVIEYTGPGQTTHQLHLWNNNELQARDKMD